MACRVDLYAQPAYNYNNNKVEYVEVLIRGYRGIKDVNHIIDFVCKSGIEVIFDLDVIDATLNLMEQYPELDYPVGINLLSKTLLHKDAADRILELINKHNVSNNRIILEVNERTNFQNKTVIRNIDKLREAGFKIALDDFGIAKSSLGLFLNHNIDIIKIDKAFVERADKDTEEAQVKLLNIIHCLIDEFNLEHIVEGVETDSQLNNLRSLGYERMQGYLYEKPKPFEDYLIDCINKEKEKETQHEINASIGNNNK